MLQMVSYLVLACNIPTIDVTGIAGTYKSTSSQLLLVFKHRCRWETQAEGHRIFKFLLANASVFAADQNRS